MKVINIDEKMTGEQAELSRELLKASKAYYNQGITLMSDIEFDEKRDRLTELERESGFAYDISPNVAVGAEVVDFLEKAKHEQPMLSLDKKKYKERSELKSWCGDRNVVVSWKMD